MTIEAKVEQFAATAAEGNGLSAFVCQERIARGRILKNDVLQFDKEWVIGAKWRKMSRKEMAGLESDGNEVAVV